MKRNYKLGLIARSDHTGLGYQTHALYKLLKPDEVLLIDSTPFNGNEQHPEWYMGASVSMGFPEDDTIRGFLEGIDVLLTCEVPYNDHLYAIAREMGVRTVLQPNAELNPHFINKGLDLPDYFFLPSTWYEDETRELGVPTYLCPPPIDINPKEKKNTKKQGELNVLHIKGKKAAFDRNGTEAVELLNIPGVNITIHDQKLNNVDKQEDIYKGNYDVVLMPRRYGGLCLPMYEALAHGLPVLMPNIPPNNEVLPESWLFSPNTSRQALTKRKIRVYDFSPSEIEKKLIEFRDMTDEEYQTSKNWANDLYLGYKDNLDEWDELLAMVAKKGKQ